MSRQPLNASQRSHVSPSSIEKTHPGLLLMQSMVQNAILESDRKSSHAFRYRLYWHRHWTRSGERSTLSYRHLLKRSMPLYCLPCACVLVTFPRQGQLNKTRNNNNQADLGKRH